MIEEGQLTKRNYFLNVTLRKFKFLDCYLCGILHLQRRGLTIKPYLVIFFLWGNTGNQLGAL